MSVSVSSNPLPTTILSYLLHFGAGQPRVHVLLQKLLLFDATVVLAARLNGAVARVVQLAAEAVAFTCPMLHFLGALVKLVIARLNLAPQVSDVAFQLLNALLRIVEVLLPVAQVGDGRIQVVLHRCAALLDARNFVVGVFGCLLRTLPQGGYGVFCVSEVRLGLR